MVPERAHKPGDRANRPGAGRSRLFRHPRLAALAFGLVLAGVVLALAEGGLRLAGFGGYAPTFRAAGRLDDGSTLVMTDPGGTASYFFADRPGSGALDPEALVRPKPAGTVRVMWVGESAAKGIPQPRPLRAASFLRAMLADAWPDRRVEVINLGAPAIASYPVLGVMREALEHEPDLVVAYLGNNEYYGAFGVSSVHSAGRSPGLIRALRALHSTAVAQALTRAAGRRAGTGTLMEAMAGRSSLGPDDPARAAAARTLGAFVGDMIDRCRERGVPIVVCTPPCNERDVAPFGEPDLSALAPGERGRLADLMRVAAESVADEPSRAEEAARAALHLHGTHATARFLLGRALLAQGREEEARVELRLAVDLDPMPWRPPAASVAAIRRAAESRGAGLADLESAFRAASPGGVVGWDLMDDHVHPSLKGQDLVARTVMLAMAALPEPVRVEPAAADALADWTGYAQRLGANPFEAYGVATRMERLGRIPLFERSNPALAARNEAIRRRIEGVSPPGVARALAEWAGAAGSRVDQYPASAAAGFALLRLGRPAEAEPLFRFAAASADPYGSWRLEFTHYALASAAQAAGALGPDGAVEAAAAIREGRFLIDSGHSTSGGAELWVGRLHLLRGEAGEAIECLLAARGKLDGKNRVNADDALVRAYAAVGRSVEARAIVEEGLRGPFARDYAAMRGP
ncbi:MAG: hypothetical protein FJ255_11585 [Phycisphaerae bacterium]|nr:hypothetical protein [Phycisphaerae bacterium]